MNGVRLTQLWAIFRVKLTDFRVIVHQLHPEWSLAPMDPFRVTYDPGVFRVYKAVLYNYLQLLIITGFYIALFQIMIKALSQCIITPVIGFRDNSALKVHFLHSLGSIPASRRFIGAHVPTQPQFRSHPTGSPFNTWVESSNVDKVSC